MRLFVAANLSDEQRATLRGKVEEAQLAAPFDYIRWIPEENWHATLAFIGDRDSIQCEEIESKLDPILRNLGNLEVHPGRIQGFPHKANPRMLAFKLFPSIAVQQAYWAIHQCLELKDRQRRFRFHATVARFKDLDPEGAKQLYASIRDLSEVESDHWHLPSITLYESVLKQSGAEYKALRTWPE